jgi:hypothetical protein
MLSRDASSKQAMASCISFVLGTQFDQERFVPAFQPGQSVRVNLEGMQVGNVLFHAAVNAAVGHVLRQTSQEPPKYMIKLLFSYRGVSEVEVTEDRISVG